MNPIEDDRSPTEPWRLRTATVHLTPTQAAALDQLARELGLTSPGVPTTSSPNLGKVLVACAFGLLSHGRDQDAHKELRRLLHLHVTHGEAGCSRSWFLNPNRPTLAASLREKAWDLGESPQQRLLAPLSA